MLRNIELIAGIASAIMSMSAVIYRFFISRIFIKKPFELLLESLEKGHSIVSPEELREYLSDLIIINKLIKNDEVITFLME